MDRVLAGACRFGPDHAWIDSKDYLVARDRRVCGFAGCLSKPYAESCHPATA